MWRILIGLLLISGVTLGQPATVEAASSQFVTITAVGYICAAPGGFNVYYVSDYEVGFTWTRGADAERTMIRGAVNREPYDINDGFIVYNGTGTDTTAKIHLAGDEKYFFRAWSQNDAGLWETIGASDDIEGFGMTLIALIILALGLTVIGFWQRKVWIFLLAGGAWFGFAAFGLWIQDTATGDLLWILGWIGVGAALLTLMAPLWLREREEAPAQLMTPADTYDEELTEMRRKIRERKVARRQARW